MMEIKKILKIGYEVSVGILLLIAVFVAIPLFPAIGNYKFNHCALKRTEWILPDCKSGITAPQL